MQPEAPGLDGTYRESCISCFRGTDSAIVVIGTEEWFAHNLTLLGLSDDAALDLSRNIWQVQGLGEVGTQTVKVCQVCASKGGFEAKVFPGTLKGYVEPGLEV